MEFENSLGKNKKEFNPYGSFFLLAHNYNFLKINNFNNTLIFKLLEGPFRSSELLLDLNSLKQYFDYLLEIFSEKNMPVVFDNGFFKYNENHYKFAKIVIERYENFFILENDKLEEFKKFIQKEMIKFLVYANRCYIKSLDKPFDISYLYMLEYIKF